MKTSCVKVFFSLCFLSFCVLSDSLLRRQTTRWNSRKLSVETCEILSEHDVWNKHLTQLLRKSDVLYLINVTRDHFVWTQPRPHHLFCFSCRSLTLLSFHIQPSSISCWPVQLSVNTAAHFHPSLQLVSCVHTFSFPTFCSASLTSRSNFVCFDLSALTFSSFWHKLLPTLLVSERRELLSLSPPLSVLLLTTECCCRLRPTFLRSTQDKIKP